MKRKRPGPRGGSAAGRTSRKPLSVRFVRPFAARRPYDRPLFGRGTFFIGWLRRDGRCRWGPSITPWLPRGRGAPCAGEGHGAPRGRIAVHVVVPLIARGDLEGHLLACKDTIAKESFCPPSTAAGGSPKWRIDERNGRQQAGSCRPSARRRSRKYVVASPRSRFHADPQRANRPNQLAWFLFARSRDILSGSDLRERLGGVGCPRRWPRPASPLIEAFCPGRRMVRPTRRPLPTIASCTDAPRSCVTVSPGGGGLERDRCLWT